MLKQITYASHIICPTSMHQRSTTVLIIKMMFLVYEFSGEDTYIIVEVESSTKFNKKLYDVNMIIHHCMH